MNATDPCCYYERSGIEEKHVENDIQHNYLKNLNGL